MAKQTHAREDLLRDATAMTLRGQTEFESKTIVIGFRAEYQVSVFWGADPVVQLTGDGLLRRLYLNGEKYAAENGSLVHLAQTLDARSRLTFDRVELNSKDEQYLLAKVKTVLLSAARLANDPKQYWLTNDDRFNDQLAQWSRQVRAIVDPVGVAPSPSV